MLIEEYVQMDCSLNGEFARYFEVVPPSNSLKAWVMDCDERRLMFSMRLSIETGQSSYINDWLNFIINLDGNPFNRHFVISSKRDSRLDCNHQYLRPNESRKIIQISSNHSIGYGSYFWMASPMTISHCYSVRCSFELIKCCFNYVPTIKWRRRRRRKWKKFCFPNEISKRINSDDSSLTLNTSAPRPIFLLSC